MSTFMSGLRGKLLGVSGGLLLLMVAGVSQANSVTYVYTDPQGTPLAEADVNGNITATFDYAPYGSIALGTAPNGPGYTGHVNDPDTQLVYMQARYYDPAVGRFLSLDPVGPAAGNPYNFNRFAYANNNPIVNTDPSGKVTGSLINPDGGGVAGPGYTMFVNPSSSEGGGGKSAAPSKSTGSIAGGALGFIASLPVDLVEDGSTGGLGALANPATTVGMTAGGAAVGNAAQNGLINLVQMASKAFSSGGDGGVTNHLKVKRLTTLRLHKMLQDLDGDQAILESTTKTEAFGTRIGADKMRTVASNGKGGRTRKIGKMAKIGKAFGQTE